MFFVLSCSLLAKNAASPLFSNKSRLIRQAERGWQLQKAKITRRPLHIRGSPLLPWHFGLKACYKKKGCLHGFKRVTSRKHQPVQTRYITALMPQASRRQLVRYIAPPAAPLGRPKNIQENILVCFLYKTASILKYGRLLTLRTACPCRRELSKCKNHQTQTACCKRSAGNDITGKTK